MKSSIKTLFVILAIVMSFVAVQAVWANGGPSGQIPSCSETVEGVATMVDGLDQSGQPEQNTVARCGHLLREPRW